MGREDTKKILISLPWDYKVARNHTTNDVNQQEYQRYTTMDPSLPGRVQTRK
jgi:hypothetical protein